MVVFRVHQRAVQIPQHRASHGANLAGTTDLFSNHSPQRCFQRLSGTPNVFPQGIISQTLVVAVAGLLELIAEPAYNVLIQTNSDSRFSLRWPHHRPAPRVRKSVLTFHFSPHTNAARAASLSVLRSALLRRWAIPPPLKRSALSQSGSTWIYQYGLTKARLKSWGYFLPAASCFKIDSNRRMSSLFSAHSYSRSRSPGRSQMLECIFQGLVNTLGSSRVTS